MRRFYAPPTQFQNGFVSLNPDETRHLREVLRLREGAVVQIFDGESKEFLCVIERITKQETSLKIQEEIAPPAPESDLNLTLAAALLKGEKLGKISLLEWFSALDNQSRIEVQKTWEMEN